MVRNVKKIISGFLCIIFIFSSSIPAFALEENNLSDYPVVVVPGYSGSQLEMIDDDGSAKIVWGLDFNEVIIKIIKNLGAICKGLCQGIAGDTSYLTSVIGEALIEVCEYISCNPDGNSKYEIKSTVKTAQEANTANLKKIYGDNTLQHESEYMADIYALVGEENVYNFHCDFRFDAQACADDLDEFIQSVKEYSGKDKVNLIAVSHGGQVSATYLTLYGYKKDVHNAVLTVPAIGGAGLAYDLVSGNFDFDEQTLVEYLVHGFKLESDLEWIIKGDRLGFLDPILEELSVYFRKLLLNWGSIWTFIPTQYYEEMKALYLDEKENALLIERIDRFHYEIQPQFKTSLQKCRDDYDINVSIIAGYGNKIVTGMSESSDGLITIESSTGATAAPFEKRFSDGYTQQFSCNGKYKVSACMDVDASTAYLPDNTWFIQGLFHGMTFFDPFSRQLTTTLLLTDEIADVYSSKEYPQFHATTNPSHSIFASFDSSQEGYLSEKDTSLVIKNISAKNSIKLTAISFKGIRLRVDVSNVTLEAGEEIRLALNGKIPNISNKEFTVIVDYIISGSATPFGERKFGFTVMNGEKPSFDENNPYSDLYFNNKIIGLVQNNLLSDLIEMFLNTAFYWIKYAFYFI